MLCESLLKLETYWLYQSIYDGLCLFLFVRTPTRTGSWKNEPRPLKNTFFYGTLRPPFFGENSQGFIVYISLYNIYIYIYIYHYLSKLHWTSKSYQGDIRPYWASGWVGSAIQARETIDLLLVQSVETQLAWSSSVGFNRISLLQPATRSSTGQAGQVMEKRREDERRREKTREDKKRRRRTRPESAEALEENFYQIIGFHMLSHLSNSLNMC